MFFVLDGNAVLIVVLNAVVALNVVVLNAVLHAFVIVIVPLVPVPLLLLLYIQFLSVQQPLCNEWPEDAAEAKPCVLIF